MNIFLTYDYELFFGEPAGSAEKCILEPTRRLNEVAKKHKVGFTYFVDVGYIIALEKFMPNHPTLEIDYEKIIGQIKELLLTGSDVQLHIHPHWEASYYDGKKWVMVVDGHYKLADFSAKDIDRIVTTYKQKLETIIGKSVHSFRAGGWCLQPFSDVRETFKKNKIKYDTTVFQGGYFKTKHYYFDFRNAPKKGKYCFENDLCIEQKDGFFTEYPIGGWYYNPLFYWNLYVRGRLNPKDHKMIGDGNYIPQPGRKWKNLTQPNWNHVCSDGYFTKKLRQITRNYSKSGRTDMVIIGHPKCLTNFGLKKLDEYIEFAKNKHSFKVFRELE